jgi:phage tail sheath gpL-like
MRGLLIIAPKASSGNIVPDSELRQGLAGPDAAGVAFGPGTPGHLAAKAIFAEYPLAQVDVIATTAPVGVAASKTITFDDTSPVTVQQTATIKIAGRTIQFQWPPGMTKIQAATAAVAAIAQQQNDLPVTAANGGGTLAIVTLSAAFAGTWGNDIAVSAALTSGAGGSMTAAADHLAAGTTEMDVATALGLVAGVEYNLIGLVTSNADAASASATSNPGKTKTKISALNNGFQSKLQQFIYAHTGALSAAKTGVASMDFGPAQYVYARNLQSLPCELMGAELGARLREESIDPDVNRTNRIDMPYRATLYVSAALTTDALSAPELEDALQSGLSAVVYTALGVPFVSIPRTTYFKDGSGNPDHRLIFVSQPTSLYAVAKDLRTYLPQRFAARRSSRR